MKFVEKSKEKTRIDKNNTRKRQEYVCDHVSKKKRRETQKETNLFEVFVVERAWFACETVHTYTQCECSVSAKARTNR